MERVSPARRGARARRKRTCWASSPERASAVARERATRASHLAQRGPGLARGNTALHRRKAASRSCSALPKCMYQLPPARRGARAQQAHVLRLLPRASQRSGAQAHYTRKFSRAVQGRAGTWEHGLAPKERRLLARAVPFHSACSDCRQRGAARARVGSAEAGPRPEREQAQWRASALHAQATSGSEGQGWHAGASAGAEGSAASRSCSAFPWCMERVSPARRGARSRRKRRCWASSQREQAQWRASALHDQTTSRNEGQGRHVRAWQCTEDDGSSVVQCPSEVHESIAASAARRARATSARAAPPPQREPAQWRATALHAQATSRSGWQGWHVEAWTGAEGTAASRSCSALP